MRRLAWLSLERRSRRASFSRSSSPASFILSTSIQAWPTCGSPGPARPGAPIIGWCGQLHKPRLLANWWPKCIYYTDFPQHSLPYSWALCPNVRRGGIHLGFDRPIDGVETAVAAARVAGVSATRPDFRLAQMFTPPPRFSLRSSTRAPSGSCRQARFSPIAAPSERAPEATGVLEGRLPPDFARPALTRNSLHPCNALRRCAPLLYRLTPADRTGCVPHTRTSTRRNDVDSHR